MTKKFKLSAVCLTAMLFVFAGCQDKDYYDPNFKPNDNKTASKSDYSTTRTVDLQVNYDVATGYVSTYDVYTENPLNADGTLKADLQPITGGINIAGLNKKRVLPAYASELYLYSTDLFIPKLMYAKVENGVASFEPFAYGQDDSAEATTRAIGTSGVGIDEYLTKKSDYYTSENGGNKKYDLINPVKTVTFPAEILSAISQAFPDDAYYEKNKLTAPDAKYFQDAVVRIKSNKDKKGANVYVSLSLADGMHRNSLSYFVYTSESRDITDLTLEERKNLKIVNIFQLADMHNNPWKIEHNSKYKNQGLSSGKAVKLEYVDNDGNIGGTFPEGAQIGFVLHSDGFDDSRIGNWGSNYNFTVKNSTRIYSIANWNTNKVKKTIFFGAMDKDSNPYSFFGFEDQMQTSINDCNDVMFNVLTDPIDAINPPEFIPETGTIEKNVSNFGILAFEDNWPSVGDYDLNDVVVKYKSKVTYAQDGETTEESNGELIPVSDLAVKRVEDVFTFINAGAKFNNGFSYKVDVDPAHVKEIKITDEKGSTVNYTAKADGTGFIIDLCPNVLSVIPAMQTVVTPAVYTVKMEFADKAVAEESFEGVKAPYNPFIMPENTNIKSDMIEVHLPLYYPTSRMDMDLFGRYDDVSKPAQNIYYASDKDTYYPFALHMAGAEEFAIPTEGQSIDKTYSKYMDWVNSGFVSATDWYKHP